MSLRSGAWLLAAGHGGGRVEPWQDEPYPSIKAPTHARNAGVVARWPMANPKRKAYSTRTATRAEIEDAARRIYAEYPEILRALGL